MDTALLATVGAIAVLLVLSAFFSGSETALTAASRAYMHQLEEQGSVRAKLVNRLLNQRERLIGAILLGNNLVNILASALATGVLIATFGDAGVVYATMGITLLVLIFGEVLPKSYAIHHANRVALVVAPVLRVLVFLLAPITRSVQMLVRGTLKLFGIEMSADISAATAEAELRGAIELHARSGEEERHERAMLRSILDLADVEVSEIMIHRRNLIALDADLPSQEIIDQALASPYTRIPLWRKDPDNIIGVLHAKALLRAIRAHGGHVEDLEIESIAATPWFIPESTTLLDQLQEFRRRREHFALVVDEYGALMGIVTLEDILEEIVGEISDELDIAVPGVRPQPDGSYIIDGMVTLRDLNREFDWRLPDEEASTIAGLVLHEARQIPEVGQVFTFYGFRFEVLRRRRNQITTLKVTPSEEARERTRASESARRRSG